MDWLEDFGSPPRAWGQLSVRQAAARCRRFTPTGVGTMYVHANRQWEYHGSPPRAWGQSHTRDEALSVVGSPPRAWGQ